MVDWFTSFDWITVLSIVSGLIGVIIGAVLNEHSKQKERRFVFSEKYLERKVDLYEKLYKSLKEVKKRWSAILKKDPNEEAIKKALLKPCSKIHDFIDKNFLYINETIGINILIILIEILDYPQMNSKKQKEYVKNTGESWRRIFNAIREDVGFIRIDQELKSLGSNETYLKTLEEYLNKYKENWYFEN